MLGEFKNIYCVEKTTDFDRVKKKEFLHSDLLASRRRLNHENHRRFMDSFLDVMQKNFSNIKLINDINMKTIAPNSQDLVISCGGDGIFLACAQDYLKATLLGVNTNYLPKDSIFGSFGALTSIDKTNLKKRIDQLYQQKYQIKEWRRLSAEMEGKKLAPYAVNDIYIGRKLSYKTCYYSFQSPKYNGEFFCSGILSCTGVGSHSWYRNAGGTPFGRSLNSFAYLILAPNVKSPFFQYSEILAGNEEISICSLKDDIVVVFDSRELVHARVTQEIKIFLDHNMPIKVIDFSAE